MQVRRLSKGSQCYKEVYERRKSTGSGLLASLSSGFAQTFRKIVSKSKDT